MLTDFSSRGQVLHLENPLPLDGPTLEKTLGIPPNFWAQNIGPTLTLNSMAEDICSERPSPVNGPRIGTQIL